ncbi:MAG: hypothetical protein HYU97_00255 [Deltaproteobacteria bacterium]|nr:hypothetical protein [Deltaproteobacteria bacterium]
MKTLTCLMLSLVLSLTLMTACGDGDESSDIIEPPVTIVNPTSPPATTPPAPTPPLGPENETITILASATGASSEDIKAAAKTYSVDLSNPTLNSELLKMIVEISPLLTVEVNRIKAKNADGKAFATLKNAALVKSYSQELGNILGLLFPDMTFRASAREDFELTTTCVWVVCTQEYKRKLKGASSINMALSMVSTYVVNDECKGFYHFGKPGNSQEGEVAYLECDEIFTD